MVLLTCPIVIALVLLAGDFGIDERHLDRPRFGMRLEAVVMMDGGPECVARRNSGVNDCGCNQHLALRVPKHRRIDVVVVVSVVSVVSVDIHQNFPRVVDVVEFCVSCSTENYLGQVPGIVIWENCNAVDGTN